MRYSMIVFVLSGVAIGPPPVLATGAATRSDVASRKAPAHAPAIVLSAMQQWLGAMSTAQQPVPESVQGLATTLAAARGRSTDAAALTGLSAALGQSLAGLDLDEESIERLAYNLFAAMSNRQLSGREVGLLLVDVMTVLGEYGAEPPAIDRVTQLLMAACPTAPDMLPTSREAAGPPVLTRR